MRVNGEVFTDKENIPAFLKYFAKVMPEQAVAPVITQSASTPRDGQGPSDLIAPCSEDLWNARLDFTGIMSEISAESAKSG